MNFRNISAWSIRNPVPSLVLFTFLTLGVLLEGLPFSLTLIAILLAHELGHSLGANHTNLLGATMFQATRPSVRLSRVAKTRAT